jgi:hypothetical protein
VAAGGRPAHWIAGGFGVWVGKASTITSRDAESRLSHPRSPGPGPVSPTSPCACARNVLGAGGERRCRSGTQARCLDSGNDTRTRRLGDVTRFHWVTVAP